MTGALNAQPEYVTSVIEAEVCSENASAANKKTDNSN
jgi:hypothetical protein